jgi:Ca-activated chloride channel homolog
MKSYILIIIYLLAIFNSALSQQERKLVREGIKEYEKQKFSEAEISFRKALDRNQDSYPADYNMANSLYKQKKFNDAAGQYQVLQKKEPGQDRMADLYHNLGNSFLEQQNYDKSIEAYKNSLKLRPSDEDTRYNLAYALLKLKEQQQNQNKEEDQDRQDNKDEQNKENQDQKQDQNEDENRKNEQEQEQKNELTRQEAEQVLEAIQNQEKQVQEKLEREKAKSIRIPNQKDW